MTTNTNYEAFKAAKQIALAVENNCMRRARVDDCPVNYTGAKLGGRMWVIADSLEDLPKPDAYINGKPAREIFGDFTMMYK